MISLEGLPAGDAAMMLIQLADRPDLDPGDPAVRQIVLLCGYLPLAIGMLARQLHNHPAWTCERLAADLAAARDRLSLMHAEDLSVAAAFDLSYENLDPDSRRIFRRLGLTPGSTADVHAAAALEGCDLIRARRLLVTLYDHYLLTEPAEDRYQMHDLIREHARAQADSDPVQDRDLAVRRLLGYYEHTAHQAGQLVPRRPPASDLAPAGDPPASAPALTNRQQAAAWLQTERHDLHAAVRYAATHGMPGHASGIAAAMHGFLREQSYWDQARSLHQAALDAARQAGDKQRQARALADLGDAQYTSSSYTQARSTFASALNLFRDLGDQLGQACVLSTLASAQLETGDCPAAASSQEQALELYRQAGSQIGQATALDRLGWIRTATGDYAAAASCQEQALALYRAAGDPSGEASALDGLAELHLRAGDHAAALSALSTALKLYHDIAYTLGEAVVLSNLGSAHLAAGNHKAADTALARALKLFRDLGATWGEAKTLHIMSNLYQATGDSPKAIAALTTTLEINNQLGTPLRQASTLNSLADLELSVTAVSDAHAHYNQSLAIAVTIGAPVEQARALEGIGHCHLRNDNPGQAAVLLRQAMNIYRALGSPRATLIEQKIADHEI
jgi:tetratricopeptide (TPR) repeat protein